MISEQLDIIRRKYFPTKVLQSISRNRVRENPGQLENYVRARHLLLSGDPNITSIAQAQCAKWLKWIHYCDGKGLIGEQLRGRLQSPRDDKFRGALGECLAGWYLGAVLRLDLSPGRKDEMRTGMAKIIELARYKKAVGE